mmetsp:Transcript_19505/g.56126  ORF Transcript_19505/g.56126 Transcript_19505/m.56126 type:complete len:212 (+) Transcript_19505:6194-6829(+)
MALLRHMPLALEEEINDLARQLLGGDNALAVKHHLRDELAIGNHHCDGTEESLEVVRQVAAAGVPGVHGDENANVFVELDGPSQQFNGVLTFEQTSLNRKNLLANGGEDSLLQSIELVEASPGSNLTKTTEQTAHGTEVKSLIAIHHHNEATELGTQRLNTLRLAGSSRAERITAHAETKGLREGQIASIRQGCLHKSFSDAKVFEPVVET